MPHGLARSDKSEDKRPSRLAIHLHFNYPRLYKIKAIDFISLSEYGFALFEFIVVFVGLVDVLLFLGKGLEHDAIFYCASLAIRVDPGHVVEFKM